MGEGLARKPFTTESHRHNGVYGRVVFCTREEHRRLRFSSVKLVEKPGSTSYLIYTESTSKNNPGGLKHRKVTTKQVTHHANTERPDRCFVEMYKQYCLHRPTDVKDDAFYLAPLSSVKGLVWYKNRLLVYIHLLEQSNVCV